MADSVADRPRRLALTVSGGVSLGSYQAGSTWALIFAVRRASALARAREVTPRYLSDSTQVPVPYVLDVVTGASAGNINGVLAAIHYCENPVPTNPAVSLFWDAWIPIGFEQLTAARVDTENIGILTRVAFDTTWRALRARLAKPQYQEGCDALIGIALTKLSPINLRYTRGLDVPLQRFAGLFRMRTNAAAFTPVLPRPADLTEASPTDILFPGVGAGSGRSVAIDSLLTVDKKDILVDFTSVRQFVEASGAFPLAFAPVSVAYETLLNTSWRPGLELRDSVVLCRRASTGPARCQAPAQDYFVDGGIFDNRPLNLAFELSGSVDESQAKQDTTRRLALNAQVASLASKCEALKSATDALRALEAEQRAVTTQMQDTTRIVSSDSALQLNRQSLTIQLRSDSIYRVLRQQADSGAHLSSCQQRDSAQMLLREAERQGVPPRLIYFVRHEAQRGVDSLARISDPGPHAGVAAAWEVLTNLYETAQNAEMHLFVNRIRDTRLTKDRVMLGVATRYPPLLGEQLGHFGAFLAKTFREYDFYAGVYDGLRSAFRELYCRPATQTEASRFPASPGACEEQWLRIVLDQSVVPGGSGNDTLLALDPAGRDLIEHFFALERGQQPAQLTLGPRNAKSVILITLADANFEARGRAPQGCATYALFIEDALCTDHLLDVLSTWDRRLRDAGAKRALCGKGHSADREACDVTRDARAVYHHVVLTAAARLEQAERILEARGQPSHASLFSVPLYAERALNEQFRSCTSLHYLRCADVNPTTSDVLGGRWLGQWDRVLPFTVGGMRAGTAHWAEWRPTAYLARLGQFSVSASLPVELLRAQQEWRPAAGLGMTIIPPGYPVSSVAYSHLWWAPETGPGRSNDLTVALFAGIIRVGLRDGVAGPSPLLRGHNVTFGLGDVDGIGGRTLWKGFQVGAGLVRKLKSSF